MPVEVEFAFSTQDADESDGTAGIEVILSAASHTQVTVDYAITGGDATRGEDYNLSNGTLTFAPGETSRNISVRIVDDALDEPVETLRLELKQPTGNAVLGGRTGTQLEINDNDAEPVISIGDITVTEGDSGTTSATLEVNLSAKSGKSVKVDYTTAADTATEGEDYNLKSDTLTFAPGETSKTITVKIIGDTTNEAEERFFVELSAAVNAALPDPQAAVTIADNDATGLSITDATVIEGDTGTAGMTFTVKLSNISNQTVTVDYATTDGSAKVAANDYEPITGTLTFNPGDTIKTITVEVTGDPDDEVDETFLVNLSNQSPGSVPIADGQGVGTIADDDGPEAQFDSSDYTVDEDAATATITVTLSATSPQTVTVDYATSDSTATAPEDYTATSGTLTFAPGKTGKTFTVSIIDDAVDEDGEDIRLTLSNPDNATLGTPDSATLTIVDDETLPTVQFTESDVTVDESIGTVTIPVMLSNPSAFTVTVDYAVTGGDATLGDDYDLPGTSLTFAPGEITRTIALNIADDPTDEADETIDITLSNPDKAILGTPVGTTVTITDNDGMPTVQFATTDKTVDEGNGTATIPVTLNNSSAFTVTVDYETSNGTATAPQDYTAISGTLTFAPGEQTKTIPVTIIDDSTDEPDESLTLTLSSATNAGVGTPDNVTLTIQDNDAPPEVSIDDVSVTEGDSGSVDATFTVSLSAPSGRAVMVKYATSDGTAQGGSDYTATTTSTLNFTPGQTVRTFTVKVNGDTNDEANETFFLNLSNPVNATITDSQGVGTITDDDGPEVQFSLDTYTVDEDATTATITVILSNTSPQTVTVDYETSNGTATAPEDYTAASGTLTFAPGEQTRTIPVTIIDDSTDELDESLTLTLSSATNAGVGTPDNVTLTIQDNDAAPDISIDDITVTEGDSGPVNAIFTISLAAESGKTVTVDYATASNTALAGSDYSTISGTLTFDPGDTSNQFTVQVIGDTTDEANETFFVNLSNAQNATIADNQGEGTITDDDAAPELSIDDVSVTEGDSGTVDATFTVSLAEESGKTVTVDYATADDTALVGSDYSNISGTLTFDPGDTNKQIIVQVLGDTTDEADETFFVELSNPVNATIADNQGESTISDDDAAPELSIDDVTVTEGNTAPVTATFTVSLAAASGKPINVDYTTADGTALAGSDYSASNGTLTFAPGTTSRTISVDVLGDTLDEAQETFFVDLTSTDAPVADGQGEGTINDNDAQPNISINDVTVTEGDSGSVDATFTVSLSAPSGRAVMVKYATSDGTAQGGSDYTATTTSTLNFTPGQTVRTFTVKVNGDTNDEANETFFLNLSNPVNATITDSQGVGTIIDDDGPTVSFANAGYSVNEDGGQALIIVTLSATSPQTVTVEYATSDATPPSATAGSDYTAASGTLSFKPGESSRVFTVDITNDTDAENPETLQLTLSNPDNAGLGAQTTATLEIIDNEPYVEFRRSNYNVDEDDPAGTAIIEVRLSEPVSEEVTVAYAIGDGPSPGARAGDDYIHTSGTLTFDAGKTSATFPISIVNDNLGEDNELVNLTISNPSANVWLGSDNTATLTIKDDEPRVQFDFSTYPNIADEDAGTVTVEVVLTRPAGTPVQVDYSVTDGSSQAANAGSDYVATSGTLTFNPGETSKTFTFTILEDNLGEWDERIQLILSNPTPNVWPGSPHNTAFKIDDNEPRITFTNNTFDVDEDAGSATITVELSRTFTETVTVDYATSDNGADAGIDYTATNGTLTFDPGDTSKTFTVDIRDDNEGENNERVKLTLSNASANALIGDSTSNLRIQDDEPHVQFAANTFTVDENAGTATIEVIRTGRDDLVVTVDYATSDDTAKAGSDYDATSGTLTFGVGETSKTFTIPINNDSRDEYREELDLTLSNLSSNAWLDDGTAELKIDDDDPAAEISFSRSNYSVDEGLGGQPVTVTLSEPTDRTVEVNYATADGSAVAGVDYFATDGTLIFNAGETSKSFTVTIINDANSESDETITLTLSSAKDAALGAPSTATITIVDND